jgi:hypothetical protein
MRDSSRLDEDLRRPPNLRAAPRAHPTTHSTRPARPSPPGLTRFPSQDQTHIDAGSATFPTWPSPTWRRGIPPRNGRPIHHLERGHRHGHGGLTQVPQTDSPDPTMPVPSDNFSKLTVPWRPNTVTSWRSTRISAFFDCALRASSPSHFYDLSEDQIQQSYRHDRRSCQRPQSRMPQVTALDSQFGTHTIAVTPPAQCRPFRAPRRPPRQPSKIVPDSRTASPPPHADHSKAMHPIMVDLIHRFAAPLASAPRGRSRRTTRAYRHLVQVPPRT